MQLLIFIISFFIFLQTLHKLVKDDHVFLRKNIKMEEFFDIAFIVTAIGLAFAQIVSSRNTSFLSFFVFGALLSLLLIGKYKKFPLGRFFDFFTLSFLISLPVVFFLQALFYKKTELIIYLVSAFIYYILAIFFKKVLLAGIMSRTLKEGRLSIFFLILFSLFSLLTGVVRVIIEHAAFLSLENILLLTLLTVALILLLIQRKD